MNLHQNTYISIKWKSFLILPINNIQHCKCLSENSIGSFNICSINRFKSSRNNNYLLWIYLKHLKVESQEFGWLETQVLSLLCYQSSFKSRGNQRAKKEIPPQFFTTNNPYNQIWKKPNFLFLKLEHLAEKDNINKRKKWATRWKEYLGLKQHKNRTRTKNIITTLPLSLHFLFTFFSLQFSLDMCFSADGGSALDSSAWREWKKKVNKNLK